MEQTPASTPRRAGAGKVVKRIGCIFFLVLALVAGIFVWWRYYYTYSDGYRSGMLQKISHKGNLFKTYEGEMVSYGVNTNPNMPMAPEKFFFSVTDEAVAKRLNDLQGQRIVVYYRQTHAAAFWRGDSQYIVDSVRAQ